MAEDLAVQVAEIDSRCKSNTHHIDTLERRFESIHELAQSVAVMAKGQEHLTADVSEIKTDVQALKAVPTKRWEQVVEKLIFGAVGALVAGLIALMLK